MRVLQYLWLIGYALVTPLVVTACLYALAWVTLCLLRFVPMIGRKHRHDRWDQLNKGM